MKKFVLTAVLILSTTCVFAQFMSTGASASSGGVEGTENYQRFYGSFVMGNFGLSTTDRYNDGYPSSESSLGFAIGYSYAFNITGHTLPLFLEAGAELIYQHSKDEMQEERYYYVNTDKVAANMFAIGVPVNLTYLFNIPNSKISIAPFIGANFKYNIVGKGTSTRTSEHDGKVNSTTKKYEIDFFDDADMKGYTANRFQMGLNLGVNVYFDKLMFGYRLQPDMSKYYSNNVDGYKYNITSTQHYITVGIRF